jgi:hypothetical protein
MIEGFLLVTVFALGEDPFVGFGFVFPSGKLVIDEFQEMIVGRGIVIGGFLKNFPINFVFGIIGPGVVSSEVVV